MRVVRVKNIQEISDVYCGKTILPEEYRTLTDDDIKKFANDSKVNQHLWSSPAKIMINNGDIDLTDPIEGDSWLKGNFTQEVMLHDVDTTHSEKALKVTPTKLEGSSTMLVSHNFCDKTTWYTESERVTSETLTVSGGTGNTVFTSEHEYWIDLTHGKVPYEHRIAGDYCCVISVDDVPLTGAAETGFTIDYAAGTVTFDSEQTGVVKACYHYAVGSGWSLTPDPGKILKIIGTHVKFTTDTNLQMDHAISFQLYIMGGAVPYGSPTIYNNMDDVIKCSMGESYRIPAFGVHTKEVLVLPFDYITSKDLPSSIGATIKIKLASDSEIPGTMGMVTANCISVDE